MNITVPQTIQTKTELEELSDVKYIMVSPESSLLCVGLKQDGVLGAYCMTLDTMRIDWKTVMNLLSITEFPKKFKVEKGKTYNGQELFSFILPEKLNRAGKNDGKDVQIVNGQMKSGILNKSFLMDGAVNSLIQLILDVCNAEEARMFFDNSQKLINMFNMHNGFSVGIGDTYVAPNIVIQVNELKNTEMMKIEHMITSYENNPNTMDTNIFENSLRDTLSNVGTTAHKLVSDNLPIANRLSIMATAGSKGNPINTGQMIVFMGQQILEGKRIQRKAEHRSLAYFPRDDDRAEARGFISRSFLYGMTYPQFVFHNMTSREGLIDTAIKTADTGYIQRKLVKLFEDILINYDNTLRLSSGLLLQFVYGDTGANTVSQYKYIIDMIKMGDSDIAKRFKFTADELKSVEFPGSVNDTYYNWIIQFRDIIRQSQFKTYLEYKAFNRYVEFMLPVNINRIIETAKNQPHNGKKLQPEYVLMRLREIIDHEHMQLVCVSKTATLENSMKLHDEMIVKTSLSLALHNAFAPKRCIIEYKLSKENFDDAMDEIIANYQKNLVEAGENVGIIAAQSTCHPLTQMTLNTFHKSGTGARLSLTQGVPRMKELLSLTKQIKTPQMTVYLDKENSKNKDVSSRIAAYIKHTSIGHIRDRIDVYYDPISTGKDSFAERDSVGEPFYTHATSTGCQVNINELPWLMRIEFNREKLLMKDVTLLDIQTRFCQMWESRYQDIKKIHNKNEKAVLNNITRCGIVSNTDNDDVPVLHIRFDMIVPSIDMINMFIEEVIDNFKIKGLRGIADINSMGEESCVNYDAPDHALDTSAKEYVIYTDGINLEELRYLNGIDINRTVCNDVMQVYEVFGVEAARHVLACEIASAVNGSSGTLNYHHLSVLVDLMSRDGFLISIDRHGIGRIESSALGKVSFEKPVEQLLTAALFNEVDNVSGVSARIMTGNVVRGGTGMCELMMDSDMLEKSEYVEMEHGVEYDIIGQSDEILIDDISKKIEVNTFIPME